MGRRGWDNCKYGEGSYWGPTEGVPWALVGAFWDLEEGFGVGGGEACEVFEWGLAQVCEEGGYVVDVGGLVGLHLSHRLGGEIGRIGLDEDAVVGRERDGLADVVGPGERGDAAVADRGAEVECDPCGGRGSGEGMEHDATGVGAGGGQDVDRVVERIASVDDDRLVEAGGEFELLGEDAALDVSW